MDGCSDHYPGPVSALDWVIVGVTVLLAFYGDVQGFIVGALSLAGFAGGAFLGTRGAPPRSPARGVRSLSARSLGLLGPGGPGGVFARDVEGLGARVRSALRIPG